MRHNTTNPGDLVEALLEEDDGTVKFYYGITLVSPVKFQGQITPKFLVFDINESCVRQWFYHNTRVIG